MKDLVLLLTIAFIPAIMFAQDNGGPYTPDENTVLLMHFNEDISNSANNGFNLTESESGTFADHSIQELGKAYRIANMLGDDDWHCLRATHSDKLNFEASFTVETWVKTGDLGNEKTEYPILIDKYESFGIWPDKEGNGFGAYLKFENNTEVSFFQNQLLEEGKWYHVALVFDKENGKVNFFVHDERKRPVFEDSQPVPEGSNGNIKYSTADLFIGGVDGNSNIQFDGWIDELRIMNRAADYSEMYVPDFTTIKAGETDHFEYYTDNPENTNYWLEIKDTLEHRYQTYCGHWNIPGLEDFIDKSKKTKIYFYERDNILQANTNTPEWKKGFFDRSNFSMYLESSILNTDDDYYAGLSGLALHTFASYAVKHRILRDGWEDYLPPYFIEGFGLYEQGYRPNRDSVLYYLEKHTEPLSHDVFKSFNHINNSSEKDILTAHFQWATLFAGYKEIFWHHGEIPQTEKNFFYYFYEAPEEERIMNYASSPNFDIYCSSRDTMFIDSFKVWLENTRDFYVESYEMDINVRYPLLIMYDEKTGMDLTGYGDFNGGSGSINISPHNFFGGFDGYDWLLGHELGHVFNDLMYCKMPYGFYHEGMANFAGYMLAGGEHRDDRWKIDYVFDYYHNTYDRDPTLQEIISNEDAGKQGLEWGIDCYFYGFEFFRFLKKEEGYTKIKEFFAGGLDFSVFSVTYDELEQEYIEYLNYLNTEDQHYPELVVNEVMAVEQGKSAVISSEYLSANDQEAADEGLFFEITTAPAKGHLEKISNPGVSINRFTEYDLKHGYIQYVNDDNSANSDYFIFAISDEIYTAGNYRFDITLTKPTAISDLANNTSNNLAVFPNPVNSKTIISFNLPNTDHITLSIFNVQGKQICTLIDDELIAGKHLVQLSNKLPVNGIYLARLTTSNGISTTKIIKK